MPSIPRTRESLESELISLMSELSEEAYCAGWDESIDRSLWFVLDGMREGVGFLGLIDDWRIDRLAELRDQLNGWAYWKGHGKDRGPVVVSIDEWKAARQ